MKVRNESIVYVTVLFIKTNRDPREIYMYVQKGNSLSSAKDITETIWDAVETEGLDEQRCKAAFKVLDDDCNVVYEEIYCFCPHVRRHSGGHNPYIMWGSGTNYINAIDRSQSSLERLD